MPRKVLRAGGLRGESCCSKPSPFPGNLRGPRFAQLLLHTDNSSLFFAHHTFFVHHTQAWLMWFFCRPGCSCMRRLWDLWLGRPLLKPNSCLKGAIFWQFNPITVLEKMWLNELNMLCNPITVLKKMWLTSFWKGLVDEPATEVQVWFAERREPSIVERGNTLKPWLVSHILSRIYLYLYLYLSPLYWREGTRWSPG